MAAELRDELEIAGQILIPSYRGLEVAWVRPAVGADRSELWKQQGRPANLTKIAARRTVGQLDPETQAARNHHDLLRLEVYQPQLGGHAQPSLLGDDQQFGVRIVEESVRHGPVRDIPVDGASGLRIGRAVAPNSAHTLDEVSWFGRNRQWTPTQRIRRGRYLVEAIRKRTVVAALECTMHGRRPDPIQPASTVGMPGRRKCGPGKLLGIQPVRAPLRRVAPFGKGSR